MGSEDYERLRGRLASAVRSICPAWLRSSEEDLIQAGMMAVMRIDRRREEDEGFSASYIRKVAYSAVVDEIRRLRSRKEIPLATVTDGTSSMRSPSLGPDRRFAAREIAASIRKCLGRLVEPRQLAVTLHLLGYRRRQIADRMGWNDKRASNLVFRGLQDLRECLRALEVTP